MVFRASVLVMKMNAERLPGDQGLTQEELGKFVGRRREQYKRSEMSAAEQGRALVDDVFKIVALRKQDATKAVDPSTEEADEMTHLIQLLDEVLEGTLDLVPDQGVYKELGVEELLNLARIREIYQLSLKRVLLRQEGIGLDEPLPTLSDVSYEYKKEAFEEFLALMQDGKAASPRKVSKTGILRAEIAILKMDRNT